MNPVLGTIYFFYYATIGYIFSYEKHLLLRKKCSEVWNGENTIVNKMST